MRNPTHEWRLPWFKLLANAKAFFSACPDVQQKRER